MEHANIAIFEDHAAIREATTSYIEHLGHTVTATAATLEAALETVDRIEAGEVACDAVLLDGNLHPRTIDGNDAAIITARLRQLETPVKIIGFSQKLMSEYGVRVDFDTQKSVTKLKEILQEL